jgi:AcrR family transcriptional regulator
MGQTTRRSSEETRRAALSAAAKILRARGIQASLEDIAREAGMSKGGLIYHFPSKDELIQALAVTMIEGFRTHVRSCIEPGDDGPGRLTRAYVRACFDTSTDVQTSLETMALMAQLSVIPTVSAIADADAQRWSDELREDGLPTAVRDLVVFAADGASITPLWGSKPPTQQHADLERQLINLTLDPKSWHKN